MSLKQVFRLLITATGAGMVFTGLFRGEQSQVTEGIILVLISSSWNMEDRVRKLESK